MRYGIMINLDYESQLYDDCGRVWRAIRDAMLAAGFRIEGRLFTIEMTAPEACAIARSVVDGVDLEPGEDVFAFLKEFYGYDNSETVNLLLPPSERFELLED
ncbi:MAG TPA: hypothetical protein ENI65_05980 [Gammaproteobacteria bacterium]|nr:hypothetical protein [Gammaproteobacteria bacterium]